MRLLSRTEVRSAIKFGYPPRPPRANALWHTQEILTVHGDSFRSLLTEYPDDTIMSGMWIDYWKAPKEDPKYRFAFGNMVKPVGKPDFACPIITDWSNLDEFLAEFPTSEFPNAESAVRNARGANPDRYILVGWGHYFHQRLAYIRGIENLLLDFYDHQDKLKAIMDRLLGLYKVWAQRAAVAGADGIWAGDDLGTQLSLFMSPDTFRELYAPYYSALADVLHSHGLDFWLHSCGNITQLMDEIVGCGVDIIHPIQAGTMDDVFIANKYGGRICFWVGMDVQKVIPFGTPDEVRIAVNKRIRDFYRPDGGLILAAGNVLLPDTPVENIKTYLETICANTSCHRIYDKA